MFLPFEPAGAAASGFPTRSRNADAPQLVYDKLGVNNLAFLVQARCRNVKSAAPAWINGGVSGIARRTAHKSGSDSGFARGRSRNCTSGPWPRSDVVADSDELDPERGLLLDPEAVRGDIARSGVEPPAKATVVMVVVMHPPGRRGGRSKRHAAERGGGGEGDDGLA